MNMLIQNPQQYVVDFLGYKRQGEIQVAIEIFLAEQFLTPHYAMSKEAIKNFKEMQPLYKEMFPQHYQEEALKPLYYFHCVDWLSQQGLLNHSDILTSCAQVLLSTAYSKGILKSKVAKVLVDRAHFLRAIYEKNEPVFLAPLADDEMYHKMLGAMTLQHRELYELELERLKNHKEYQLRENFSDVLESTMVTLSHKPLGK